MFRKNVKPTNTQQLNQADKKTFKECMARSFPRLSSAALQEVVSKKSIITCYKLETNDQVKVYVKDKIPIIIEYRSILCPTIFFLWKHGDMLSSFVVHKNVEKFIQSGADLMLRGVIGMVEPGEAPMRKYGNLAQNEPVYVCFNDNKAATAVGLATKSSADMRAEESGKCVFILHCYGDWLTLHHDLMSAYPNLGAPKLKPLEEELESNKAFPPLQSNTVNAINTNNYENNISNTVATSGVDIDGAETLATEFSEAHIDDSLNICNPNSVTEESDSGNTISITEESGSDKEKMDKILYDCFFGALKYSKTLKFPILVSQFYKNEMLPFVPNNEHLELRKSSYPKLKQFLSHYHNIGLIRLETSKGVESIESVNKENELFRTFYLDPKDRPKIQKEEQINRIISEKFVVTAPSLAVLKSSGFHKGDIIPAADVKKALQAYVKANQLPDRVDQNFVKIDATLKKFDKFSERAVWSDVHKAILKSMTHVLEVQYGSDRVETKGETPYIKIGVEIKSNKKVTYVDNLEAFCIKITEFSRECMIGLSASTNIIQAPGSKNQRLTIQGNQVNFVNKLLSEKYKIPQRFVLTLEQPKNKKKK